MTPNHPHGTERKARRRNATAGSSAASSATALVVDPGLPFRAKEGKEPQR